jgi:hypothetical protein
MQSVLAFVKNRRKLVLSFTNVDPQRSGSNLHARHHNHLSRNEMKDIKND